VTTEAVRIINVTKLDAVQAQLREAITLFFEERSPIAIHTLVLASHQIAYFGERDR
jgi:hypothetical protein